MQSNQVNKRVMLASMTEQIFSILLDNQSEWVAFFSLLSIVLIEDVIFIPLRRLIVLSRLQLNVDLIFSD
jgi:hypothetical protein